MRKIANFLKKEIKPGINAFDVISTVIMAFAIVASFFMNFSLVLKVIYATLGGIAVVVNYLFNVVDKLINWMVSYKHHSFEIGTGTRFGKNVKTYKPSRLICASFWVIFLFGLAATISTLFWSDLISARYYYSKLHWTLSITNSSVIIAMLVHSILKFNAVADISKELMESNFKENFKIFVKMVFSLIYLSVPNFWGAVGAGTSDLSVTLISLWQVMFFAILLWGGGYYLVAFNVLLQKNEKLNCKLSDIYPTAFLSWFVTYFVIWGLMAHQTHLRRIEAGNILFGIIIAIVAAIIFYYSASKICKKQGRNIRPVLFTSWVIVIGYISAVFYIEMNDTFITKAVLYPSPTKDETLAYLLYVLELMVILILIVAFAFRKPKETKTDIETDTVERIEKD